MAERFTTPVGRFVQGDAFVPQTKDQSGAPRVIKQGPNAGQPNPQFFMALAIPKTPGVVDWRQEPDAFFQTVFKVGTLDFPGGQSNWPNFAWKIIDGDSPNPNQQGRIINTIEGFRGHWVCRFASSYAPKCFARPNYAATDQINDPNRIKRGHYLTVNGSVSGNGNTTGNPGVYLNLDLVSWEGFGPEIMTGPDAAAAFGGAAPALPPGASMAPVVAPVAAPFVATPAAAAAAYQTPAAPNGAYVAPTSPSSAPPYAGYMAPPPVVAAPPPPPVVAAPPPVPATPGPQMLPAANGATYQQMIALGWTDTLLVQHGMMVA